MVGNKRTYVYTTELISFSSLEVGKPVTVNIGAAMDFVWTAGLYTCNVAAVMAGTDVTHGGFLLKRVQLSDQDSILKTATPIGALFGTPGLGIGPLVHPYITRVPFNATIELVIDNLVSSTVALYLSFIGFQWPKGEPLPAPYTA